MRFESIGKLIKDIGRSLLSSVIGGLVSFGINALKTAALNAIMPGSGVVNAGASTSGLFKGGTVPGLGLQPTLPGISPSLVVPGPTFSLRSNPITLGGMPETPRSDNPAEERQHAVAC